MLMKKIKSGLSNRQLLYQLTIREVSGKYKGSFLGILWTVITPLIMLAVYTIVFSEIFQSKWGSGGSSKLEFAQIVYCGLATFGIFSESISKAPTIILSNVNYVKKVIFPLYILPVVSLSSALITASINFAVVIIFNTIFMGTIHWTIILLPIILLPIVFLCLGLSWFLASLGVYFRDIGHVVGIGIQALMLLSPIFYSVENIPSKFKFFYNINPITHFVENIRGILIWGRTPGFGEFLVQLAASIIVMILGYVWFAKTRKGFADVI